MTEEKCENCKYWDRLDRGELNSYEASSPYMSDEYENLVCIGRCRRMPPQIIETLITDHLQAILKNHKQRHRPGSAGSLISASEHPVTWDASWCGEWKPRIPLPTTQTIPERVASLIEETRKYAEDQKIAEHICRIAEAGSDNIGPIHFLHQRLNVLGYYDLANQWYAVIQEYWSAKEAS